MVAIAIYTYPRAGELRVLRWEDVDLEDGCAVRIMPPLARPRLDRHETSKPPA